MQYIRDRLAWRPAPRPLAGHLMQPYELDDTLQIGMSALGATGRRNREAVGLWQRQLGRLVGMNQSTISRLENGQLRRLRFERLAMVFGVLNDPLLGRRPRENRWS